MSEQYEFCFRRWLICVRHIFYSIYVTLYLLQKKKSIPTGKTYGDSTNSRTGSRRGTRVAACACVCRAPACAGRLRRHEGGERGLFPACSLVLVGSQPGEFSG